MKSTLRQVGRFFLVSGTALAIALVAGALFSVVPESPLEGLHGGMIVAGALMVAAYFIVLRFRGSRGPRSYAFTMHSYAGLITGLFLSLIFLTGVLLLYRAEIDIARNPWLEVTPAGSYQPVDAWIEAVADQADLSSSNRIDIEWPANDRYPAVINVSAPEGSGRYYIDPYNASLLEGEVRSNWGLIRSLHVGLNLGTPGHWLAGLVSLAAIWLCIGGLTMGRNVFREWNKLRLRRGASVFLSDFHKRIGLWLLPFIAINAFAGMLASGFDVFSAGPIDARFEGNVAKVYEAVGSPPAVVRTATASTPPKEELITMARQIIPNAEMSYMRILGFGDQNELVSMRVSQPSWMAPDGAGLLLNVRSLTGEVVLSREIQKAGSFEKLAAALSAFHVAEYGPRWIRELHAITAAIIVLLPVIGILMWAMRRSRRRRT